jgi:hypothetical protein
MAPTGSDKALAFMPTADAIVVLQSFNRSRRRELLSGFRCVSAAL